MTKSGLQQEQEPPTDEEGTPPYQRRYRWVMLALVWLLYCVFGIVGRSIAPLITPILKDLDISYTQMGLILGSWPLTYIVVALIAGALIDRWGIRKSLFVGILVVGLSEILRYFANGFVAMFFMVALYGVGGPMISIGAPKTVAEWFRGRSRGTAVGIYMTASWIGGLIAYSTANSVVMPLTGYSWRLTFAVYSLLVFVVALLWWFLSKDIKSIDATERAGIVKVFRGLIGVRNIQLILIMGLLSFAIGHGFNDWLPQILETGGLPPAVAGFAASIPLVTGIPAVMIVPHLVPPHLRGRIAALVHLALAIALWIVATTSGAALIAGLAFYGVVHIAAIPLLVLILMDTPEVGAKYMGSATGMYFCVAEIGGFGGPFVMGALVDLTGTFLAGAGLLAGLSIVVSVLALSLKIKPVYDTKASL
ncbi:CynX/NimT family MFS transporter [Chloroflexota bacterium]